MKHLKMLPRILFFLIAGCIFSAHPANAETKIGDPCGPVIKIECPAGSYCAYENGDCGKAGRPGKCEAKIEICPQIFMPVCGCDGKTYGNDCTAKAAGQSIAETNACSSGAPTTTPNPDANMDIGMKESAPQ